MKQKGDDVIIPACQIEFREGGNTIWVHSPLGATILRIKLSGAITTRQCNGSEVSHADLMAKGDLEFCLGTDVEEAGAET